MGRVIWTELALDDIREILLFVAKDSPRYALRLTDRFQQIPARLSLDPRLGWRVPEFDLDHIREVLVRPYRVIYTIRNEDCYIIAVIHGSRNLENLIDPEEHLPRL